MVVAPLADPRARPIIRQLMRFGVVGVANTVTSYTVIWLCHVRLGASVGLASAAGYAVGMIQGFILNRFWTFAGDDHALPVAAQVAGFVVVNVICGAIFTQANVWLSAHVPLMVSSLLATALVVPLSFALNRLLIFQSRREPAR